ncbi:MAG: Ig-like domain-containing protein, partial [Thermomicrobiaceae bacterium]
MKHSECDAIRPLISAALDGDLDEAEFVQLSEHLAVCAECREIHQDYFQLRDGLRSSSSPTPPPQLARSIWQETVEKPPPPAIVRLASRASFKLGMSTMAASIIVVIVVAIFAAQGYDRQTIPVVASSQPVQNTTESWPVSSPVRINFNKDMNQASVMEHLVISPSAEQERLPTMWEGNSLIIGRSHDHSVLLRPETDYRITVLEEAEDHHGNPIGEHWTLRFQTGPRDVSITTPTSPPTV